jgi:hypothetical protein
MLVFDAYLFSGSEKLLVRSGSHLITWIFSGKFTKIPIPKLAYTVNE